jgi:hypothetical protein
VPLTVPLAAHPRMRLGVPLSVPPAMPLSVPPAVPLSVPPTEPVTPVRGSDIRFIILSLDRLL